VVNTITKPCLTCSLAVSLACLHDDVRAEPGSWLVVGMIPIFDRKKAERAGRPEGGPNGAPCRRIHLTHQCLEFLLEGWNALTEGNKVIQWADGLWRRTRIMLAAIIMDQPETDVYCCDTAQSCKLCNCPKCKLHEPVDHPPKYAYSQEMKVLRAADGYTTGKRLFTRTGSVWTPTADCTQALYERTRQTLNGTHIMHNALWGVKCSDVQQCVSIRMCMYLECICMYLNVCVYICFVYVCILNVFACILCVFACI
jgi:hypothetical protein